MCHPRGFDSCFRWIVLTNYQNYLAERLDKASTAYGMEISAEKTKLMTNNTSGMNTEIRVNRQKLETVTSFKYLGSVIADESSKPEILSSSKIRLMSSLIVLSDNVHVLTHARFSYSRYFKYHVFSVCQNSRCDARYSSDHENPGYKSSQNCKFRTPTHQFHFFNIFL